MSATRPVHSVPDVDGGVVWCVPFKPCNCRAHTRRANSAHSPRKLTSPLAGALAGAVECCTVQPLDIVKTRHQLNPGVNSGVLAALKSLVREGGVKRCVAQPSPRWMDAGPTHLGAGVRICRAL